MIVCSYLFGGFLFVCWLCLFGWLSELVVFFSLGVLILMVVSLSLGEPTGAN